jgi:hypothetical protein
MARTGPDQAAERIAYRFLAAALRCCKLLALRGIAEQVARINQESGKALGIVGAQLATRHPLSRAMWLLRR